MHVYLSVRACVRASEHKWQLLLKSCALKSYALDSRNVRLPDDRHSWSTSGVHHLPPVLMQEDPAGGLDGGGGRGEEESGEGVVGDAEMSDGARDVRDVGGACPQTVPATEEVRERLRARERERERESEREAREQYFREILALAVPEEGEHGWGAGDVVLLCHDGKVVLLTSPPLPSPPLPSPPPPFPLPLPFWCVPRLLSTPRLGRAPRIQVHGLDEHAMTMAHA